MIASDLATTSMTTFSRFQVALRNCEQVKKKVSVQEIRQDEMAKIGLRIGTT